MEKDALLGVGTIPRPKQAMNAVARTVNKKENCLIKHSSKKTEGPKPVNEIWLEFVIL